MDSFEHIKFTNASFDNGAKQTSLIQKLLDDEVQKIDPTLIKKLEPKASEEKLQPRKTETAKEYIDKDKSVSDIEKSLHDLGFFDN
ncbi:hypothetical protein MUB42_01095 [Apilactobacillus kunkeei]|nr:hypothetical protein MUB42_01095 [Apilactobacillus kunkeei]